MRTPRFGVRGAPPALAAPDRLAGVTELDEHGRPEPPEAADETTTLLGFLDYHRATFAWKTAGLDAAGLATTVASSTMTLGGMTKHLALVEHGWFWSRLLGREDEAPWKGVDWEADRDWEWHSAADDTPDELRRIWNENVARSRAAVDEALAEGGLDQIARQETDSAWKPSLRWILVHMIEEYARHNGHADLIREAIDGETGE
jgi:uncharacterized damage-inducible protein DinB